MSRSTPLPSLDPRCDLELSLSAARRIDERCERFEQALRDGETVKIEDFFAGFSLAERPRLLRELLALELEYRARRGQSPVSDEYSARFADYPGVVDLVFAELIATELRSTANGKQPAGAIPAFLLDHPRYDVLKLLGRGGMGAVYLARQRALDRPVALKVIRPELLTDASVIERFQGEARAAASLSHPNIVAVYDAESSDAGHFLVMEHIAGADLARTVLDHGPLSLPVACDYARQTAAGLQHAYEHGMVHRDITPRNLMLTDRGQVKILDFGLAQLVGPAPRSESPDGSPMLIGCLDYMAPEQAADPQGADIRADIYSLGCTLYFLLTGRAPFPRGEWTPTPISSLCANVPTEFTAVLERMLAKDPAARFQTPAEVAAALAPFAAVGDKHSNGDVRSFFARHRWAAILLGLLCGGLMITAWHFDMFSRGSFAAEETPQQAQAQRLYREGLHLLGQRKESQVRAAIGRLETAIGLNPHFPLAQTALADAYNLCGDYNWDMPDEVFSKSQSAARQAIEQDPQLAEAHLALAFALNAYLCDRRGAEQEYRRALELNPRLPGAHHWYAWFLAEERRTEEADREIGIARQLAPDDLIIVNNIGKLHYLARNYSQAVVDFKYTLELDPDFRKAHRDLGLVYAELGQFDLAIEQLQQSRGLTYDSRDELSAEAYVFARNGQGQKARSQLTELEPLAAHKPLAYQIAAVYAALGEHDQTFLWLDRAIQEHSASRSEIDVDPRLDGVREDPRFAAERKATGLGR